MIAHPRKRGGQNPAYRPSGHSLPCRRGTGRAGGALLLTQENGRPSMKVVEDHIEVTDEEASSGIKGQGVRYVLGISIFLAVIVLSAVWIIPALLRQG